MENISSGFLFPSLMELFGVHSACVFQLLKAWFGYGSLNGKGDDDKDDAELGLFDDLKGVNGESCICFF
ncbi:hypothetical protein L6452_42475 [Arctium lappa]|uniref:Uncharacterized protein n=1 Tax=Arctium lappa TaxID=4217 RepID=A0ACB8XID2_ARCLA|nr:hypothetical protein L6452_42475 [Arctium lappa]